MAGLPWIKVAVDLPRHPKSTLLAARLDDPRAWTYVVALWAWTAENYAHGEVPGADAALLMARGAGWLGDADAFCRHLVAVGFIETTTEGLRVHDWTEWAGAHIEKKAKDAIRKAKSRGQSPQSPPDIRPPSAGCPRDVRVTDTGRPADDRAESATQRVESRDQRLEASPREAGASDRAEVDARVATPNHDALVARLRAEGIQPSPTRDLHQRKDVDAAVAEVGVDVAVSRVKATWDRTCSALVFYIGTITGRPKPGQRRQSEPSIKTGSAAPAAHAAFGQGGVRAID